MRGSRIGKRLAALVALGAGALLRLRSGLAAAAAGARAPLAAALGLRLADPGRARAADTQSWIIDSAPTHAKSETRVLVVSPEGVIELGPRSEQSRDDSLRAVASGVEG